MIIIITKNMPILTDYFQSQLLRMSLWIHGDVLHDVWVGFCLAQYCYISRQITFWLSALYNLSVCQGSAICMIWIWYCRYRWGYVCIFVLLFSCFEWLSHHYRWIFNLIKCINTQSCSILSITKQTCVVFNTVTQCLCSHRILSSQMHCKMFAFREEGVSCSHELCVMKKVHSSSSSCVCSFSSFYFFTIRGFTPLHVQSEQAQV